MEKISVTPWSISAQGDFSVKFVATLIAVGVVAYGLGQLSVIKACFGV